MIITTRKELAETLQTHVTTTRELRYLEANPPRMVRLLPHIERFNLHVEGKIKMELDDPSLAVPVNADGTGPTLGKLDADGFKELMVEHEDWTKRYTETTETSLDALQMIMEAIKRYGTPAMTALWEALPDDGTPDTVLDMIP